MVQTQKPPFLQTWLMAARPKTLPAAVGPVLVGTSLAIADGLFVLAPALAALLAALLLQIGSNLANDYFDFFRGADPHDRLGPTRVTSSGLLTPVQVRNGMVVVFCLAALIGVYLVYIGGLPIMIIGLTAILAAIAYTGGPLPYGYYGLGELFVFLFFGLAAVCGTYYVQALTVTRDAVIAAVPVGALVTAILVVNNYRDIDTDRRANKRTLAVLLGRRGARIEFVALLAAAYLATLWLALGADRPAWLLLPWLTLPLTVSPTRSVFTAVDGPALNKALAATARLGLFFSLLLALGIVLGL
jgi:1,4-dihydroxy-2-naphthoate octaprenyltransferase